MDDDSFQALDAKLTARLDFLARKAGVPPQDCRDVVQEAMSAAVKQLRRKAFRGESTLGTWLQGILRIKIADYWRSRRRVSGAQTLARPSKANTLDRAGSDQAIDRVADGTRSPETVLAVREALTRLTPTHRLVLLLNQYGGYTCEEIAKILGKPAGTVGRMLAEAKHRFREAYTAEKRHSIKRLKRGGVDDAGSPD